MKKITIKIFLTLLSFHDVYQYVYAQDSFSLVAKYQISKVAPFFYNPHYLGKWYLTSLATYPVNSDESVQESGEEIKKLKSPILFFEIFKNQKIKLYATKKYDNLDITFTPTDGIMPNSSSLNIEIKEKIEGMQNCRMYNALTLICFDQTTEHYFYHEFKKM